MELVATSPHRRLCRQNIRLQRRIFDPEMAAELWPNILQHKWFLSEKLGRDWD